MCSRCVEQCESAGLRCEEVISPLFLSLVADPLLSSQKVCLVAVRCQSKSKPTSESMFPPPHSSQTWDLGTWSGQAWSAFSSSSCSSIGVWGGGSRTTSGYFLLLSFCTWFLWYCGQRGEPEMREPSLSLIILAMILPWLIVLASLGDHDEGQCPLVVHSTTSCCCC